MSRKGSRRFVTFVMDVLVLAAVVLTMGLVTAFFGRLASQGWGKAVVAIAGHLTIPFGVNSPKTPYGGVFDIDGALSVGVLLVGEWLLSLVRSRE